MSTVLVRTKDGLVPVWGEKFGPIWAVTRSLDPPEHGDEVWDVTHLPTGRAATARSLKKKTARRIAARLQVECAGDRWARTEEDWLAADEGEAGRGELRARVRRIIADEEFQ